MAYRTQRKKGGFPIKLVLAAGIILFSLFKYWSNTETNEWTGRKQHITLEPEQEIALGLQSLQQMAHQYGGLLPDQKLQNLVDQL